MPLVAVAAALAVLAALAVEVAPVAHDPFVHVQSAMPQPQLQPPVTWSRSAVSIVWMSSCLFMVMPRRSTARATPSLRNRGPAPRAVSPAVYTDQKQPPVVEHVHSLIALTTSPRQ